MLAPSNFPQTTRTARGRWAPIYLSPILGSPERLVVAVAVVGDDGFHIEAANKLERLKCFYGRAAETALFAVEVALGELEEKIATEGQGALKEGELVFSNVSIGIVSEGEARTIEDLGRVWMSAISSLYESRIGSALDDAFDSDEKRDSDSDRLPALVLDHVIKKAPGLKAYFHEDIRQKRARRLPARIAGISIDFNGSKFVANFSTFKPASQAQGVDRIKRKMFDLKVQRDNENASLFAREYEMIVYSPSIDDPLLSEKQYDRIDEVIKELTRQSTSEGLGFRASSDVKGIGDRVLAAEVA